MPLVIGFSMNWAPPPVTVIQRPFEGFASPVARGACPGAGSPVGHGNGPNGNFFVDHPEVGRKFVLCHINTSDFDHAGEIGLVWDEVVEDFRLGLNLTWTPFKNVQLRFGLGTIFVCDNVIHI